jgi:hypothetical protein
MVVLPCKELLPPVGPTLDAKSSETYLVTLVAPFDLMGTYWSSPVVVHCCSLTDRQHPLQGPKVRPLTILSILKYLSSTRERTHAKPSEDLSENLNEKEL